MQPLQGLKHLHLWAEARGKLSVWELRSTDSFLVPLLPVQLLPILLRPPLRPTKQAFAHKVPGVAPRRG